MDTLETANGAEVLEAPVTNPQPQPDHPPPQPETPTIPERDPREFLRTLVTTPAHYSNYFLNVFTPEGFRLTFGESWGKPGEEVSALHTSVFINLETAMKLVMTLQQACQSLMNAKQQQVQTVINAMMNNVTPAPPPNAPPA